MSTIEPPTIPAVAADITADWLGAVLGARVDDVQVTQIVVKLPALDQAAVFTSTVLRMYRWWDDAEDLVADGVAVSLGDPVYPAVLPIVFAEGWEKLTSTPAVSLPPSARDIGDRFTEAIPALLQALAAGPATLLHGDFRADNMLFDADELVLLDFQLIGSGRAAYDLAYFTTQSLGTEVAAAHEQDLFDRWVAGLARAGVADTDREQCWLDYRRAALFCLTYPVVASRGMDLDDPRQLALVQTMIDRYGRAAEELDLAELLEGSARTSHVLARLGLAASPP